MEMTPLMNDDFNGEPAKRALHYIQEQKKKGHPVVVVDFVLTACHSYNVESLYLSAFG